MDKNPIERTKAAALCAGLGVLIAWQGTACATPYTVDPSLSSITITGVVLFDNAGTPVPAPLLPQAPLLLADGVINTNTGLTAFYSGTINATLTATDITFTGSGLAANNSGTWAPVPGGGLPNQFYPSALATTVDPLNQPLSNGPGEYGFNLGVIWAAVHDLEFSVTSGALPLAGSVFVGGQNFDVTGGAVSYTDSLGIVPTQNAPGSNLLLDPGFDSLVTTLDFFDNVGPGGVVTGDAPGSTLIFPVAGTKDFFIGGTRVIVTLEGAIAATVPAALALSAEVPEPATFALAGLGIIGLAPVLWRRRRRATC